MNRRRTVTLIAASIVAASVAACGRDLTAPLLGTAPLQSESSQSGAEITIRDADGTSFTLEVASHTIRRGDGLRIVLSETQLPIFATAFEGIINSDPLAASIDAEPMPQPDNWDCANGGYCDASTGSDGVAAGKAAGASLGGSDSDKEKAKSKVRIRRLAAKDSDKSHKQIAGVMAAGVLSTSDWPPNCVDIARAIHDATAEYRRTRSSVLNTLKEAASTTFEIDEFGRPTIHLPNLPALGYVLEQQIFAKETAELTMNIFATMYASYGCWGNGSSNWPATSYGNLAGSVTGSVGGTLSLVCHSETWEITYDGGESWSPIQVSVCEYMMT